MKEFDAFFLQNDSYEILEKCFDIGVDVFKILSVVIFSVQFILPNVTDCQFKDHLHNSTETFPKLRSACLNHHLPKLGFFYTVPYLLCVRWGGGRCIAH